MQWMLIHAFAYELQLFDRFCASQKVTKIGRTIRLVLDADSLYGLKAISLNTFKSC